MVFPNCVSFPLSKFVTVFTPHLLRVFYTAHNLKVTNMSFITSTSHLQVATDLIYKSTFAQNVFLKLLVLSLPLFLVRTLAAQSDSAEILRVGVKNAAPFILNAETQPNGKSVELWEIIAERENISFTYVPYSTTIQLVEAAHNNEIDLSINPTTVTTERMEKLYFSQPYFISETVMAKKKESLWLAVVSNIFSKRFFAAAAILLSVILIFGILTWFFERNKNEEFRKGIKGMGDGFWWSAVTMTTVGYGDKSPVTLGGRVIAFIWMFAAIILISSLTAGIASALTVQSLENRIDDVSDLKRFKVGSIKHTGSGTLLNKNGVPFRGFSSVEEGLAAVDNEETDFFVYDKPILNYHIHNGGFNDLTIAEKVFRTDYFSFLYPKESKLRDRLDPRIVEVIKSGEWNFSNR